MIRSSTHRSGDRDARVLRPVAGVSRRDAVVHQIKRAIVLGGIKPGERLTEAKLSAMLAVSRPTVREALNQMAREGLVVQEPYRGLRIAELDAPAILDMAEIRMTLDMHALQGVLDDDSGDCMTRFLAAWAAYERDVFSDDPIQQHEAHVAFHRGIWAALGNTFLVRLWGITEAHITIAMAHDEATRHDPQRAHDIHREIVLAVTSRDLGQVRAALVAHARAWRV